VARGASGPATRRRPGWSRWTTTCPIRRYGAEQTPYDAVADARLAEPIGTLLPALAGAVLGRDGPVRGR
jgi:hypothetical protein